MNLLIEKLLKRKKNIGVYPVDENEWQDFIYRTKGEDKIMTKTPYYQIRKKNIKIAIRGIDIFANDTMIIKEINK